MNRWLAKVITLSGQAGTGGSVRSASTSFAVNSGVSIETIPAVGDWSQENTFRKFYCRAVPFFLPKKCMDLINIIQHLGLIY